MTDTAPVSEQIEHARQLARTILDRKHKGEWEANLARAVEHLAAAVEQIAAERDR